jgi:S1 RNA binding domain protein
MNIEVGTTIKGTVVKVADYGAIVRLPGGKTGLVHISEIADAYVRDVRDYLNEQDEVTVKVLRLNDRGRYELSVKQGGESPAGSVAREPVGAGVAHRSSEPTPWTQSEAGRPNRSPTSFEDRLSRFMKDSEERLHELRRNIESKRGRR